LCVWVWQIGRKAASEVLFHHVIDYHLILPPLRCLGKNGRTLYILQGEYLIYKIGLPQVCCAYTSLSPFLLCRNVSVYKPSHKPHLPSTHTGPATHRPPRRLFFAAAQPPPQTRRAVLPVLCLCLSYAAAFMPATPASALRGECLSNPLFSLAPHSWRHPDFARCLNLLHTPTRTPTYTRSPPENTPPPPPLPPGEGGRGWR